MRVIYQVPISAQILDAIIEADKLGKRIEYIEVTDTEMEELKNHPKTYFTFNPYSDTNIANLHGARIKLEPRK